MSVDEYQITHMADINVDGQQETQGGGSQGGEIIETPDISILPNYLKEWLTLEDEMKVMATTMREKKKRMGVLQGLITKTMKGHKIGRVNIKSGAVLYQNKISKETMGKKFMVTHLTEYFKGDILKAKEVYDYLEAHRGQKTKENIKLERN